MNGRLAVLAIVVIVVAGPLAGCTGGGNDGGSFDLGDGAAGNGNGNGNAADLGYAVGGAQDVNNFRDNVESGYLPIRTDVTHEGLFYDYYFETGSEPGECEDLFCPTYSRAVTTDPFSNETDHYLSVGLNSNIDAETFERERLNLVVVLDVSGSMDSPMASYHYDGDGNDGGDREDGPETQPRMTAATEATVTLFEQLEDDDRFGLVTFASDARTEVELERVGDLDGGALREDVRSIEAGGGTDLSSGMDEAREQLEPYLDGENEVAADGGESDEYETRVVYLTDAQPNQGDTSVDGLESRLAADAENGIHSTFVGVGMDFNTEIVDAITSVRGANYYAVHSAERFERRMGEEFEYMVTPMVFDLELALESEGYEIEAVYGSPETDQSTGELMRTKTLFPSPTENGSTKGGVVLLKLDRVGEDPTLELAASYEDRDGERHRTAETVSFEEREPGSEYFENDATRKAVALSRYATLMQNWIDYERGLLAGDEPVAPDSGDELEEATAPDLGRWERESTDLRVSPPYAERIHAFSSYFAGEIAAVDDESMERELELVEAILEESDLEDASVPAVPDEPEAGNETANDSSSEPNDTDNETSAADGEEAPSSSNDGSPSIPAIPIAG